MTVILVGIDFSIRSDRALRRATLLARDSDRELLLVGVIEEDTTAGSDGSQKREASALLRRMARTLTDDDGVCCRAEVRSGRPAEQLTKAAQDAGVDLVVIGPHRRGLIRDAFGAVTAERIVRESKLPVLAANSSPAGPYRRLLLPVDLTEGSPQVAHAARNLDLTQDAEIVLLHFYDHEAREMLGRAAASREMKRDYLSERADMARRELADFAADVGLEGATQSTQETRGPVAAEIERFALDDGSDLIIVPRSHKGPVGRCLLGSVTEDLLRSGRVDVLVVPSD